MRLDLRRALGAAAIVTFAVACGVLAALGHTPVAIALVAAAAALAAVMSFGSRRRDLRAARDLTDLRKSARRLQRDLREVRELAVRLGKEAAARDRQAQEAAAAREQRLLEKVVAAERRLVAGFEAERLRAAQRHREEMVALSDGGPTPGP
ncbi:hypothetical protein [Georgenia sp. MJ170]|uniref:hypothetical protein n=1 Tax=Georgenia sunbinii TaxID=3117728 RepID=UPI002F267F48